MIALFALLVYGVLRMLELRRSRRRGPSPLPPTRRVVGPDDDADFLRELERRRRRDQARHDKPRPAPEQPKASDKKEEPPPDAQQERRNRLDDTEGG